MSEQTLNRNAEYRRPALVAVARVAPWLLAAAWLVVLLVHEGHPSDEGEHAHAAWLMGVRGLAPVKDFFEHHPPLLWQLLRLGFAAGIDGLAIFWFGRVLVVVAALLFAKVLIDLSGRRGGALATFMAMTAVLPSLLVIRPESASLGFFALALLSWCRRGRAPIARDVASGVFFALACLASPRFALLAPAWLLFGAPTIVRLARAVAGSVATMALVLGLGIVRFEELRYDVAFSALLQTMGPGTTQPLDSVMAAAQLAIAAWALFALVAAGHRRRAVLLLVIGLAIGAVCAASGWRYPYPQAFSPAFVWLALALADGEARTSRRISVGVALAAVSLFVFLSATSLLLRNETLDRSLRVRAWIASQVTADETVWTTAAAHPITAPDSSYYWLPLLDGPGRICATVAAGRFSPRCDPRDPLKNRPIVIDLAVLASLPPLDRAWADDVLAREYEPLTTPVKLQSAYARQGLWRRKPRVSD